jgi:hypothetical protein
MIIRAPGIGSEEPSTVSETLEKKSLICAAKFFGLSVYHEPAFKAGLVSVSVSILLNFGDYLYSQYVVINDELAGPLSLQNAADDPRLCDAGS